jgi:hypothetical protein
MGWTQDSFGSKVDGHDVVVEARSGPISARFALKVDGEVQDMTKAIRGEHFLEGEVPGENGAPGKPFRVRVVLKAAGIAGEEYYLEVDGEERKFGEGYIV